MMRHANLMPGALLAMAWLAAAPANAKDPQMSATDTVAAVGSGRTTARALVERAIEAAGEHSGLNAFITLDAEGARAAADAVDAAIARGEPVGPLAGLPIVAKDNINAAGLPTTAGTPALAGFVPEATAPVLARLTGAGAVLVGKTNMHELAFGITSDNAAFGAVGNAVAPGRFAGGSSGGTAAAVAAGIVPAGLGTDTGGSVRIPAALNGLAGLRPSMGRYPQDGIVPISTTRDTAGPIARTVADLALIDAAITGENGLAAADLSSVRLGIAAPLTNNLSAGTAAAFERALERLRNAGATLVEVDLSEIVALNAEASFPIALYEVRRDLAAFLAAHAPAIALEDVVAAVASPDVKAIFDGAVMGEGAPPEALYRAAMDEVRPAMQAAYEALFAAHALDAIIFPATPLPAQPIEGSDATVMLNGEAVPTFQTFIRNTDPGSVLGVPGLTVPMGAAEGLPVGLELDARAGDDRALLALGLAIEPLLAD